jgi:hypothetical protein
MSWCDTLDTPYVAKRVGNTSNFLLLGQNEVEPTEDTEHPFFDLP